MSICIEGFDINDDYFTSIIEPNNNMICDLTDLKSYDWYINGQKLDETFNDWEDTTYQVYFKRDFVQFKLNNIITPLLNKNNTIMQVKNILSIKDNIYFNNSKLKNNMTLNDYMIGINDVIHNYVVRVDSL